MQRGLKGECKKIYEELERSLNAKRIESFQDPEDDPLPLPCVSMQRGLKVHQHSRECITGKHCLNAKRIERILHNRQHFALMDRLNAKRIERQEGEARGD